MLLATVLVGYFALIYMMFLPESPFWLMIHGRRIEGIQALNKIAKFNGKPYRLPLNAPFNNISVLTE